VIAIPLHKSRGNDVDYYILVQQFGLKFYNYRDRLHIRYFT